MRSLALAGDSYDKKEYTRALSTYLQVLTYYPDDIDATSGASWCSYFLADPQRAFRGFSKIVSVNADYPYARRYTPSTSGATATTAAGGGDEIKPSSPRPALQTSGLRTGSLQTSSGL